MTDPSIVGGCLCGAVRYAAPGAEPAAVALCHCDDCQRQSGAPFSLNVVIDADAFRVEDSSTLRTFNTTGQETGEVRDRVFCGDCGSPIYTTLAEMGGMIALKAGTLDDRSWLAPEMELWCDRRHPWVTTGEERGEFATGLPT